MMVMIVTVNIVLVVMTIEKMNCNSLPGQHRISCRSNTCSTSSIFLLILFDSKYKFFYWLYLDSIWRQLYIASHTERNIWLTLSQALAVSRRRICARTFYYPWADWHATLDDGLPWHKSTYRHLALYPTIDMTYTEILGNGFWIWKCLQM